MLDRGQIIRIAAVEFFTFVAVESCLAKDFARIFVYSRRDTQARSWLAVHCGGAVAAELKRGYFFAINVAAGQHTL